MSILRIGGLLPLLWTTFAVNDETLGDYDGSADRD
jgi:hypothetical protein